MATREPKFLHFWQVLALAKMAFFGNIWDSRRRIWRVLSEFGEFGEGRLDRFIHNISFFVYKTT
jgi:hypothetical protein